MSTEMVWTEVGVRAEKKVWAGEQPGEFIYGVVTDFKEVTRKDGTTGNVLTLNNEDEKQEYSVWPKSQLLRLLTEANIQIGQMIKIQYEGKEKLKTDKTKSFRKYKLFIATQE
jgi:hypothetical protein